MCQMSLKKVYPPYTHRKKMFGLTGNFSRFKGENSTIMAILMLKYCLHNQCWNFGSVGSGFDSWLGHLNVAINHHLPAIYGYKKVSI